MHFNSHDHIHVISDIIIGLENQLPPKKGGLYLKQ